MATCRRARLSVVVETDSSMVDVRDSLLGYRSFGIVTPAMARPGLREGIFLLNGQPVFLRGADVSPSLNAFWYWRQQDKLLDAVLMAKAANFNAIRACTTLARACYNNPGVVLLSVASETHFDPRGIVEAVRAVDPERILIPISGNMKDWGTAYDQPPGYSLPPECWNNVIDDFHCYYGWYSAKAQIWKFSRRRQPARLVTVGEFGAEALDAYTTMAQHYPPHFQPTPPSTADALWGHVQVQKADPRQIIGFRGQRPINLGQYIEASQSYQADVLAELATGFRLSPRYIGGYFQFHFIDALPAHWPKSVVSHDFRPKKGYFEMAQVNQPVAPLFQIVGQGKALEIWLANDLPNALADCRMTWTIKAEGKTLVQGEKRADAPPLDAALIETINLSDTVQDVPVVTISLALADAKSKLLSRYQREVFLNAWRLQDALFPKR